MLVAVISINLAVVIGGTLGRSEGVLIVIMENIPLSFMSALRFFVLEGVSNGFHCDWQRAEFRYFAMARRISVALAICIGILWGK